MVKFSIRGLQDLIREEKKDGRKPTGKRRNDKKRQRNRREDDSKKNKPLYMRKRPKAVKPEPAEPEKGNEAAVEAAPALTEVSEAPNTSAENRVKNIVIRKEIDDSTNNSRYVQHRL